MNTESLPTDLTKKEIAGRMTFEIATWLLAISVVPAVIGGLTWRMKKLSTVSLGVAVGIASSAIFVLAS